jgi:hypothetical protein
LRTPKQCGLSERSTNAWGMKNHFKGKIYKAGINWCVDVPIRITKTMTPKKGYIKATGQINGFDFSKNLVPVKNKPYRLFVNLIMMKGAKTALGKVASFKIEQDFKIKSIDYAVPSKLTNQLKEFNLTKDFNGLTPARKKDILKYLNSVKSEETLLKNITKIIEQLKSKVTNVRVP